MSNEPRYPDLEEKELPEQVSELKDYIVNLHRYIRYANNHIDKSNLTRRLADEINTFVDDDGVIHILDEIDFNERVDFTDYVTFTNLSDPDDQTVIDAGHIKTGTIDASVLNLSSYAKFSDLADENNYTIIHGGNILTGTIDADQLSANAVIIGGVNLLANSKKDAGQSHSTYNVCDFDFTEQLKEGQKYTLTAKVNVSADKKAVRFYHSGGATAFSPAWLPVSEDGTYTVTFTATAAMAEKTGGAYGFGFCRCYASNNTSGGQTPLTGTANVEWIQIERGNRASDWSSSAKDIGIAGTTIISGGNITTGTIDASTVTVTNIDAAEIKSGKIDTARLNVAQITAGLATAAALEDYSLKTQSGKSVIICYKSAQSGTNTMAKPDAKVTDASGDQRTWTTKRPQYDRNSPVLFLCWQTETVSGDCDWTTPVKDDTTTVIDGGHITTGTIDAARIAANSITADKVNLKGLTVNNGTKDTLKIDSNGNVTMAGTLKADSLEINGNITWNSYNPVTSTSVNNSMTLDGIIGKLKTSSGQLDGIYSYTGSDSKKHIAIDASYIKAGTIDAARLDVEDIITAGGIAIGSDITDAINDIEIGGRNLLREIYKSYSPSSYRLYQFDLTENLVAGETYTLQFWDVLLDSNSTGLGAFYGGGEIPLGALTLPDDNGYWSVTFTVNNVSPNAWIHVYNYPSGHTGANGSIGKWKLEKGNKATDWTPCPADLSVDGATIIHGGNITTNTIKADKLSIGANDFGSENLLKNSSFSSNLDGWTMGGTAASGNTRISINASRNCLRIDGAIGEIRKLTQSIFDKIKFDTAGEQVYTLSADICVTNYVAGTTNPYAALDISGYYDNGGTSTWMGIVRISGTLPNNGSNLPAFNAKGWQRVNLVFKFSEHTPTDMSFSFYIRDCTGYFYFRNVKLERGYVATDWTPAPDDIDDAIDGASQTATKYITSIDSNGISIHAENNASSNYTKINANGMTVYKGGTDVASFGDTARIGKSGSSRFLVNSSGLSAYDSSNFKYLDIAYVNPVTNIYSGKSLHLYAANDTDIIIGSDDDGCTINLCSSTIKFDPGDGYIIGNSPAFRSAIGAQPAISKKSASLSSGTTVSVPSGSATSVLTLSLTKGTWLVFGFASIAGADAKFFKAGLSTTTSYNATYEASATGNGTNNVSVNPWGEFTLTATTTIRLFAYHNVGSAKNCVSARINAYQIG